MEQLSKKLCWNGVFSHLHLPMVTYHRRNVMVFTTLLFIKFNSAKCAKKSRFQPTSKIPFVMRVPEIRCNTGERTIALALRVGLNL